MDSSNKMWVFLIFVGVAFIFAIAVFDILSVSSGQSSRFNYTVVEMPGDRLFSVELESKLVN